MVISQPSHPWTAGASHLHTREFARQVRGHLNPGGIFVQWSNVYFLDADLLRSMVATLLDVFSHVRLYRPDPNTLLFLASDLPMAPEVRFSQLPSGDIPVQCMRSGISSTEALAAALVLDTRAAEAFAAGAKPITDDDNRLATSIVYETDRGLDARKAGELLAAFDVLQDPDGFIFRELAHLDFGYIGSYLESYARIDPSVVGRIDGMARALGSGDQATYLAVLAASLAEGSGGNNFQGRLGEALAQFPDSGLLRCKAIEPYFSDVVAGTASTDIMGLASALPEAPASVLSAAGHAMRGEWAALAAMDDKLAGIRPTAAWAATSAQLRVEWRLRVQNPELVRDLSLEAMEIIDARIVRIPNLPMLALRAWTGYRAGSSEAALGSIGMLARRVVDTKDQLGAGERASLGTNLEALTSLLGAIADQGKVDKRRVEVVRSALSEAIDTL
jgi:hypothetical protein